MLRDPKALLAYEARRTPALQAALDRADALTDAEIDRLPGLPWIKAAVRHARREQQALHHTEVTSAALEDHVRFGVTPDPSGVMRRWCGPATFLTVDRGGGLEVMPKALLWLPREGGLWLDTAFSRHIDPRVFNDTIPVGHATLSAYRRLCTAERQARHPGLSTIEAPTLGGALSPYGVRIERLFPSG